MKKHGKKKDETVIEIIKDSGKTLVKGITEGMGLRKNKVGKGKIII